jgi:DNA-binding GntR family transcriptional regulator
MTKGPRVGLKYAISQKLREEIISGKLLPGERITETWLADKFKCSRGPIREALNQLGSEGFLRLQPNHGAVVTKTSSKDVEDFYALLELLESKAVEWATPRLGSEDIIALKNINQEIIKISKDGADCIEQWIPLNLAFHRLFRERCGNSKLNGIIEEIRMRITRYRYASLVVSSFGEYINDHEKIIQLVEKGDALAAAKAMREHILRAKGILMDVLFRMPNF